MKLQLFTRTFEKNEFRSILGRRKSNFWIILSVFLCAIGALEFSRAGIKYLSYKMNDPFINWIELGKQENFEKFRKDVVLPEIKNRFSFGDIEANNYINENVVSVKGKMFYAEGRTISHDSRLIDRILDEGNTVAVCEAELRENDYGWIVTQELMERLGYDDPKHYPLYINRRAAITSEGTKEMIEKWNLSVVGDDYIVVPIPIWAVVRQLPSMLDFIAPKYYYCQREEDIQPFNLCQHQEYFSDLRFVVEDTSKVIGIIRDVLDRHDINYNHSFEINTVNRVLRPSYQLRITVYDSLISVINAAGKEIVDNTQGVYRVYDYFFDQGEEMNTDYISVMFDDLSKVDDFAKWTKDEYGIRVDMTQIEAKKNFETFSVLVSVLCVAIIVLSILFVSIFLWFLIDAHFKAISKNLGTIMAFGLPNRVIMKIYRIVFLRMILYGLFGTIAILGILELTLLFLGVTRDGGMEYIRLMDWVVWSFVVIVPVLTALVINITMKRKLQATPGDLIFERNN